MGMGFCAASCPHSQTVYRYHRQRIYKYPQKCTPLKSIAREVHFAASTHHKGASQKPAGLGTSGSASTLHSEQRSPATRAAKHKGCGPARGRRLRGRIPPACPPGGKMEGVSWDRRDGEGEGEGVDGEREGTEWAGQRGQWRRRGEAGNPMAKLKRVGVRLSMPQRLQESATSALPARPGAHQT